MFCCGFFLFLWHFAALYLRDGWGDRPETFTHDWKCVNLDFGGLKFGGGGAGPPKNLGVPQEKNVGEPKFKILRQI